MPTNKFIGDDDETDNLVIIRKSDDEDEFLKWADDMDAADDRRARLDALTAMAARGVDVSAMTDRPARYLREYVQARVDSGGWSVDGYSRADTVEERGSKWVVLSKAGDVLATYDTQTEAEARLRQIEIFKHAR